MADSVIYRVCKAEDAPQLRGLWKLVFQDTDSFLDFYFSQRFVPAYSVCTVVNGEIVGGIFGLPCAMNVRGVAMKASMSSGFCTHPDHRRKGYFSNLYALYLQVLRKNGVVLAPNTPVYHDAYFRFETRSASRSRYLTGTCPAYLASRCQLISGEAYLGDLLACYDRNMGDYAGSICRSFADFRLRLQDCASDGGKILGIFGESSILAYAIFFENQEKLLAIEVIADDEDVAKALLFGLANQAKGRQLEITMPPDSTVTISGLTEKIAPQGVCALVNLERFLALVGKKLPISMEITDVIVPENNGIFNFSGEKLATLPAFSTTSGFLLQGLLGYHSFAQLKNQGNLRVYDHHVMEILEKQFPAQTCYILESY